MMVMWFLTLLSPAMALLSASPVVSSQEPSRATGERNSVSGRCGKRLLEVRNIGLGLPNSSVSRASGGIFFNGHRIQSAEFESIFTELSDMRSAYRLTIQCTKSDDFNVHFYRGTKQQDGSMSFAAGEFTVDGNGFGKFSGLQTVDAETFWFR
jgi:hypothetical protein